MTQEQPIQEIVEQGEVTNSKEAIQTDQKQEHAIVDNKEPKNTVDEAPAREQADGVNHNTCCKWIWDFYWGNEFVCLVVIVILLARAYPPLGADYLQPHITSTWIAVLFIFGK